MGGIESDYLVVGSGAAGMAFTDALLGHSNATVTIVDRHHAPGGHWNDAYPFVRLHQPSAFYGVHSVPFGSDTIDPSGPNAGFYDLAGVDEIRAYYDRVMQRHFLPTGRVRYFPSSDWIGEHRFVSRVTGVEHEVRARKIVDTTYVKTEVPAVTPPPFDVAEGVRLVTPDALTRLERSAERIVIVGGGKTALDAAVWLLERGVPPSSIRWIRPREGWWMNRKFQQPHALLPDFLEGMAVQMEAMAQASSIEDLFARLESAAVFLRLDPSVTPTMLHGAILSERELELLRGIEDVVRLGHVRKIERDAIVLDGGRVPTDDRTLHVHCSSRGLARPACKPIFEPQRITLQPMMWGFVCYQFAMLGVVEATLASDDEKNALCPPIRYWDRSEDYALAFLAMMAVMAGVPTHPTLASWNKSSRLNPLGSIGAHKGNPRVAESRERMKRAGMPAAMNLRNLTSRR